MIYRFVAVGNSTTSESKTAILFNWLRIAMHTIWFLHHMHPRYTVVLSFFPVSLLLPKTRHYKKTKWWTNVEGNKRSPIINYNGGWKLMSSADTKPYKHLQKIWTKVMAWYLCEDWRIFAVSKLVHLVHRLHTCLCYYLFGNFTCLHEQIILKKRYLVTFQGQQKCVNLLIFFIK